MSYDPRKQYVLTAIATICGGTDSEGLSKALHDSEPLNNFLDDASVLLLQATATQVGGGSQPTVKLANTVDSDAVGSDVSEVHFVKLRPEAITPANLGTNIMVSSLVQSPLVSLYHAIHSVYAPSLLTGTAWSGKINKTVQDALTNLEQGLGPLVRSTGTEAGAGAGAGAGTAGASAFAGIVEPCDEFQYWEELGDSGARGVADTARTISGLFESIRMSWIDLKDKSLSELLEVLDETQNTLDDVWREGASPRDQYSEQRMRHFLGVLAGATGRRVQAVLGSLSLWTDPFSKVRGGIREGMRVCEQWATMADQLTGTFWSSYEGHAWVGKPYQDSFVAQLLQRLDEILRLRTTHEELLRLLSADDQRQLHVSETFKPFSRLQPLHCNSYTQPAWEAAVTAYEQRLAPVEARIADDLRRRVAGMGDRPLQLLREFGRYKNLLRRPNVARELAGERDTLLAQLSAHVEALEGQFEGRSSHFGAADAGNGGRNLSPVVNSIVWSNALRSKVSSILSAAAPLLGDLSGFRDFKNMVRELIDKLGRFEKEQFNDWTATTQDELRDGDLSLEMSGRVMDFDVSGNMVVNYSEKLVILLREVRQLTELGHAVHKSITNAAADAEKYYRFGIMLKKVANFYNTMGSQIIETQKPMLYDTLVHFETTVKNPTGSKRRGSSRSGAVTWSNPQECQDFVERLQRAADAASSENRKLRKVHQRLGEEMVALMNMDLLRQREEWKSRWNAIQAITNELSRTYPERMQRWLLHWDHQMYKSMEVGYCMGLESLNENLAEIKCELVFTQRQLQFRPPLEELRANYYREMRKFISIPAHFTGFGNTKVYSGMADHNAASLVHVYRKAEILFARLTKLSDSLKDWVILGMVDLDAFVEQTVTQVADWDINFKMLKHKRKESERIPDFQKVDCVAVSLAPFKAAVEDQLQRLSDALVLSLRKAVSTHLKNVESFLEAAMERLNNRPNSIDEIGKAKREWQEIAEGKADMREEYRLCEDQKRLLLSVAGTNVSLTDVTVRLAKLPDDWDTFEVALDAFNDMIEEERGKMRGNVEQEVMNVNVMLDKFSGRWRALRPMEVNNWNEAELGEVYASLTEWRQQLEDIQGKAQTLRDNCETFMMPPPKFQGLEELEADFEAVSGHWDTYRKYDEELAEISKQDWITFRRQLHDLEDFGAKWKAAVEGQTRLPMLRRIYDRAHALLGAKAALVYARGEPFKEEHWSQVFRKLNMPKGLRLDKLTVGHFLDVIDAVSKNLQFLKELTGRAQGEVNIREALQDLRAWGETAEFKLMDHVCAGRQTPLICEWKDLFKDVGDHQSLLQSLKESQYFKPFADQAQQFEVKLALLDQCCQNLNAIQRKWVYLEPIFGRGALPEQQARFKRVDDEFREIMQRVEMDAKVLNMADDSIFPGLRDSTATMLDQLERCQKALADFLEEKRSKMPRFYFIGDDDLLEILGQAKNPAVIQAHLKKLFQGIHRVEFNQEQTTIVAMCSVAGEVVPLTTPVTITEDVEVWLDSLCKEMVTTLAAVLVDCVQGEAKLRKFPSQILCLAEQVHFTNRCERAIQGRSLPALRTKLKQQLENYTSEDLSSDRLSQLKVKALVLDLIHHIDVVEQLIDTGVSSTNEWLWQKQLRFYLGKDQRCVARMCDAECQYTYEYQGNSGKLVHTPLTDKCYLTLTQGMAMGMGGNPYGPAGTGKTESVKALGAALGRQVLVFNCDEGIDFQSMGRIFTGLVKCGAWGCFDEFNRLKEDQLSAVSQQIQVIQAAIKEKTPSLELLGSTIDVDFNAGIFVTMNPAGKGYGGRSKLPDNLKQLFRPVAMSKPDNELIAEVILYAEGFRTGKALGRKMVSLFTLAEQLLTPQQHYDWGLRAMKTCLNTGGNLIQAAIRDGEDVSDELEQELLIKAVRVNTLSKLTFDDGQRFLGLIKDVFPGVSSEDIRQPDLEDAIRDVMTNKPFCLEHDELQVRKMLQLKESLDQRMGCVIVGPSGCGKSTLWRVLQCALQKIGQTVITHVMNPKSMPRQRLLGEMDPDTREWTDGVLTAAARQVVKEPMENRSWIVCDGDVDPEWIESLNSVLDDNHLLTLPNGERINFGANVNFLFETHDLRFASPATISRMGMIFLSDEDVDVERIVKCWLRNQDSARQSKLEGWMADYFQRALDWVLQAEQVVDTTMVGTVLSGLSHVATANSKGEFVVGLIRGLGGNLTEEVRTQFAKEVFQWAGDRPADPVAPLTTFYGGGRYQRFVAENYDGRLNRKDLERGTVIQTVGVQRVYSMIKNWVQDMEPFILVGPEGCGKTMLINFAIQQRKNTSVTVLHCNAQTTAEHVIQRIRQACVLFSTNAGRTYRPREGDRLVLFLKDINLPRPDKYDTCLLVAFLQQLVTFNGFYDENLEFLSLERVHIVATMNPATTVGRHHLSTRFTAIVRIAYMDYPTASELNSIYANYFQAAFAGIRVKDDPGHDRFKSVAGFGKLAQTMVDLFTQVRGKFSIDDHRHYLFTPRDLTKLVHGMLRYNVTEEPLLEVFAHESQRMFRDRLVDMDSCAKFDSILAGLLRSQWKKGRVDFLKNNYVYSTLLGAGRAGGAAGGAGAGAGAGADSDGKGDDGDGAPAPGGRGVKLLSSAAVDDFVAMVQHGIKMYEREEKDLHMLLFQETLDQIARIDRLLSEPGGSILMVGRAGVGRRNATNLVAHMHGHKWFSPSLTREYGERQFFVDVKQVLQVAGVEGEDIVMYLEDFQFTSSAILETVNSLLSSGEVPGLYTHEELEPLLAPLRDLMGDMGFQFKTPYEFFTSRVQQHLHVVVAMDPSHPDFLMRCESNPALYSRCSILWLGVWNKWSMREVPHLLVPDMLGDDEQAANTTVDRIMAIHASCADRGATPRDYVNFLEQFEALFHRKHADVADDMQRLEAGLNKLEDAAATVDTLTKEANEKRSQLVEKQAAADEAMVNITDALSLATKRRGEVQTLQVQSEAAEKVTAQEKNKIEQSLADVNPLLEQARTAVGGIKSDHLNEIRSLKMPPEPIVDVLSAVLTMLGIQDTSWLNMKKFLGNRGVKEDILAFDTRRINNHMRKTVRKILDKKKSSFEAATIKRVSRAAAPLAAWVKANIRYSEVLEQIAPLERQLREATHKLDATRAELEECEAELIEIDHRVEVLRDDFGKRTSEAERLKMELKTTEDTLERAQSLLGQLSGERSRWDAQVKTMRQQVNTLPAQALVAAGFVTYLAQCPEDVRSESVRHWASITHLTTRFEFTSFMSTESQLLTWKAEGLPADQLSMENALVITNSGSRCPFIIDPARAATSWLERHLSGDKLRPLEVVPSQDARLQTQVELAVRFGKSLMILEVDGVEPMLVPLVRRDLVNQGPRQVVQIGEKTVDYNENFRMFLCTRNPNPVIGPDTAAIISLVNFTVTRSGLEGQLLGVTLQHEQPELERQKSALLAKEEELKVQLATLEKGLLVALAESSGNILDNTALIDSLTKTKVKAADIESSLEGSAKASAELDRQREVYRPFAHAGSTLFFLVSGVKTINHMYQFSLQAFIGLFKATLSASMDAPSVDERIKRLASSFETRVLMYVGRSLFKADRLMFALHMVHGMHPKLFEENEWEFFVGDLVPDMSSDVPRDFPNWASAERAPTYRLFSSTFPSLNSSLNLGGDPDKWARWGRSPTPEKQFPAAAARGLSAFQRLLVIQTLRPDRLVTAMSTFVCEVLAVASVAPPPVSLMRLHDEESEPMSPVLMITTTGADPSKELEEFAAKKVGRSHYSELAMGGGQQETALRLVREAAEKGDWVCLKNLHLVVSWLPRLEKALSALQPHKRFRLWLTTESHDSFSTILLQQSLKITFEAPPGLKKNMERTYEAWSPEFIAEGSVQRAQLLFLLAWFHAIVQERRTYVPQGWTKAYEFSFADVRAGATVIDNLLATAQAQAGAGSGAGAGRGGAAVPWKFIHGLFENAIYGGRVDNPFDGRVLSAYLTRIFSADNLGNRVQVARGVSVPASTQHRDFMVAIAALPEVDEPNLFVLPDNIERSVQRATSRAVLTQLKSLAVLDAAASSFDREQWRAQLGPLLEMWNKLTSGANAAILDSREAEDGCRAGTLAGRDPVEQFVAMEFRFAARLVSTVNNDLSGVRKVVYGSGMLTPQIQSTASALLSNQLPRHWEAVWEGPDTPKPWIHAVLQRRLALKRWADDARTGDLLEQPVNLAHLFSPGTFLNALRQQTARRASVPIDTLKLVSGFNASVVSSAQLPITLTGLLLQGASFDNNQLGPCRSDAAELVSLPNARIAWVASNVADPYPQNASIKAPLYFTPMREKRLSEFSLPCSGDPKQWILAGVAAFLSSEV